MSVKTYVETLGSWLKQHFSKVPAVEVQISSGVNYLAPFVEELGELVDPSLAAGVNPVIEKIKTGLAALAVTIKDSSVGGKANVVSIVNSLASNAGQLEAAFQVKDPATQARATAVIKLIAGEVAAIRATLAGGVAAPVQQAA